MKPDKNTQLDIWSQTKNLAVFPEWETNLKITRVK